MMARTSRVFWLFFFFQERNLEQQNKDKEDIFKRAEQLSKTSLSQAEQRRELALVQQSFVSDSARLWLDWKTHSK